MKRLIVVEGCDRTGKSTFISKLSDKLKKKGFTVYIFHLMGPTKFDGLTFNNDEKSLIQLAKFNDELEIFNEILKENDKNIIILDRSHFGEYVWAKYWNRTGKYTDYLFSNEFFKNHNELFSNMIYIDFYMSNIISLVNRINSFDDDKRIFSENGKTIIENINNVYKLFDELSLIIKKHNINYLKIDNSSTIEYLNNNIILNAFYYILKSN